jgi:tRNA(Arg) A34 adenosine deaminase TadA
MAGTAAWTDFDVECMRAAISEAALATSLGNMPFGAVLALDGRVVCRAHNGCAAAKKRGGSGLGDVTRHAEMELVRNFTKTMSSEERSQAVLYTSTEPCEWFEFLERSMVVKWAQC